jgi:hypothetical protein
MWDDRFLFVAAALIAFAVILGPRIARLRQTVPLGRQNIKLGPITVVVIMLLLLLVVGSHFWYNWYKSFLPNVTSLIAILLGAIFGSFTAHFVSSLFGARFGRRDPIIGASVLLLLSIAYSFPLYSAAISDVLSGIGLSSVKTPFLELTVRERGSKSVTAAVSGATSNSGQVPRTSDPVPGLTWLRRDTTFDTDAIPESTLPSDEDYIYYFDSKISDSGAHKARVQQIKTFLFPAKRLSQCLQEYVQILPDAGLLLVDVKPVIESIFMLHARAKQDAEEKLPQKTYEVKSNDQLHFWLRVNDVLSGVNKKFDETLHPAVKWPAKSEQCKEPISTNAAPITVDHRQPYGALVLADLIQAHGSPDEAIAVLVEWLNLSDAFERTDTEKRDLKVVAVTSHVAYCYFDGRSGRPKQPCISRFF